MVRFRRVFQLGIIVFSLGSFGCTFAHSLPMLAFARAIQGFGAAGIMSQNGALVRFTYPSKMLGRGLGLNALVASAGAALGPTVASGILAVASWQWLFAVNVPIGIGAYLLGRKSLPDNPKSGSFDLEGTLLSASMFGFGFIGIDLLPPGRKHLDRYVGAGPGRGIRHRSRPSFALAGRADRPIRLVEKPALQSLGGHIDRIVRVPDARVRLTALLS